MLRALQHFLADIHRVPFHLQALAQAQLFDCQVLPAQANFLFQGRHVAGVAHQHPEQVGKVFQRGFGATRLGADQRQHGVEAVEQEMRPDARLQRLQARFHQRRRKRPGAQLEVMLQCDTDQRGGQRALERMQALQAILQQHAHGPQADQQAGDGGRHQGAQAALQPGGHAPYQLAHAAQRHQRQQAGQFDQRRGFDEFHQAGLPAAGLQQDARQKGGIDRHQGAKYHPDIAAIGNHDIDRRTRGAGGWHKNWAVHVARRGNRARLFYNCEFLKYPVRAYYASHPGRNATAIMTAQLSKKGEAWSARFSEPVSDLVKRYTASVFFDKRLAQFDIQGSLAHADMLAHQGIISAQDLADIQRGMAQIEAEIAAGSFEWLLDLEDVHLNIEKRLTELVGDAGKRLHTGRSRNDQVATDIRLYMRAAIDDITALLRGLQAALLDLAEQNADTILPGFTHMQVAQPVTFGHHMLAYVEMFGRDAERMADCRKRVNRLPLGAAALAGTTFPIDRVRVAQTLGFEDVCHNSLDAVSDRDFAIEFCAAAALVMTHISRMSEELVIWMSPRVGFIDIADRFCTGSSIMPQKKNPDVPELARGKTGRVNGHLVALLTLMKGQPLAYNKDNQEDKEPLFDTVDTVTDTLRIFADMAQGITVKPDAMRAAALQGYATATDLADYLVKKGLPFRDAHEAVAHAVRSCDDRGCDLADLPLEDLRKFSP